MMSNAGGSFDNAKKLVESGEFGARHGKASEWHNATVAGDTLGDGMKDAAGPSLNILQKLMTSIGLVTIGLMNADQEDGWIGAILLGVTLLIVAVFGMWNIKLNRDHRRAAAAAAAGSAGGVPAATREKLAAAARRVGEVVDRERARVGVGVGAEGQAVYDALAKTLPVSWQGTTITILDTLHLPPPYTPAALRPVSAGGAVDELARVRMVLTNERAKLALPAAPAAAPSVVAVAAQMAAPPATGAGPTAAVAPAVRGAWRSRGQPRV
eukprot:TRINITY_DN120_c1_g1_i1.p1 TRINITY_DN120_c1_g1~~TRINITY_DN120_c1_g1_i1.p1  ORF type:complete len:291 (+),score=122.97 TRINITY_DN120_c1_g1_i1:71-874(+)